MDDPPGLNAALSLPWVLVWVGAVINLAAGLHYTYSTVRAPTGAGQPKPNPVSWGIWSLSGWLAFAGQVSEGVRNEALLTLCVAAVPTFIFVASIVSRRRYGAYRPVSRLDVTCGALAVLALVAWRITASGTVAVALSILCDALVAIPVVRQAYRDPSSDSPSIWVAGATNALITLGTFRSFTFLTAGFGVYFLGLCLLVSYLLVVRPRLGRVAGRPAAGSVPSGGQPVVPNHAATFAAKFAAEYLTWDEAQPHHRGTALTGYIAAPADPLWGWSGHGRQRADLVILGDADLTADGYYLVDVRVRVVGADCSDGPPTIVHESGAALQPVGPEEDLLVIPVPGPPGKRSQCTQDASDGTRWFRLHVPVVARDGEFCIPT